MLRVPPAVGVHMFPETVFTHVLMLKTLLGAQAGKEEFDDEGHLVMTREAFEDSIFEMADLWCTSTKLQEYDDRSLVVSAQPAATVLSGTSRLCCAKL